MSFTKGRAPVARLWGFDTKYIPLERNRLSYFWQEFTVTQLELRGPKKTRGFLVSCICEDDLCRCSGALSCPTLCDPMDPSTSDFLILHYLPEFAQTQHPLGLWCHPTISSSVIPFSCPQSFPWETALLAEELWARCHLQPHPGKTQPLRGWQAVDVQLGKARGAFLSSICETLQGVEEAGQARMRSQEMISQRAPITGSLCCLKAEELGSETPSLICQVRSLLALG